MNDATIRRTMPSLAGKLLVATPVLLDPNFYRCVLLLIQHDDDGALGVVLNRPTTEAVDDHLPDWSGVVSEPPVIHFGGPVQPDVAVALGATDRGLSTGLNGVTMLDLDNPPETGAPVRIYSGYSGWSQGQLEEELAEGAWYLTEAHPNDPFADADTLWRSVLRRQNSSVSIASTYPDDAGLN